MNPEPNPAPEKQLEKQKETKPDSNVISDLIQDLENVEIVENVEMNVNDDDFEGEFYGLDDEFEGWLVVDSQVII